MVAPLIGAGIRAAGAAARGLAKKFGKKTAKEKAEEKAEREAKGKIQKEAMEHDREVEEIGNKAYRSLYPKKDKLDGPTAAMAATMVGVPAVVAGPAAYRAKKVYDEDKLKKEAEEREAKDEMKRETRGMKKGGMVKSSASKRADGIAMRGKTRGRMV